MKKVLVAATILRIFLAAGAPALEQERYPVKAIHPGASVTPLQAYRLLQEDPQRTFLVDVRTRYEYQDVGHPAGAYNVPLEFYTTETGRRGYRRVRNENFVRDLQALFNPETDILLFICRSGERSISAAETAIEAGFGADRVYNIRGGFEGDPVMNPDSPFFGKRAVGGWRLEGLPWTYEMDRKYMYRPDLE
jgi:rhodanese-related sulfurtransferase